MVQLLERPQSQIGEYSFDSNDCPEPGCPGPQIGEGGVIVCGLEDVNNLMTSSGLGTAALVNCTISKVEVVEHIPDQLSDEIDEEEDEPEADSKPDIYIC